MRLKNGPRDWFTERNSLDHYIITTKDNDSAPVLPVQSASVAEAYHLTRALDPIFNLEPFELYGFRSWIMRDTM